MHALQIIALTALLAQLSFCAPVISVAMPGESATPHHEDNKSYLVELKETVQPSTFTKETGIKPTHLYAMDGFSGFAAYLTENQVIELRSNPQVADVLDDVELELASSSSGKKRKNAGDKGDSGKKKTEPQSPTPDAPARRRKKRKTDVTKPSETDREPTGDRESMASKSTK
ncbi:hypothetical protein H0H93_005696 [Arthromyces matolae]|nr:hypothetical protein H0H93_005696 [Arthromyces matolae]